MCANEKIAKSRTQEDFDDMVKNANKIYSNKYVYIRESYHGHSTPFTAICPIHGKFKKDYYSHITLAQGCPKCMASHMEQDIIKALIKKDIEFIHQYKASWLGKKRIDIFLPKYNIAIECQGMQHFRPSSVFGGENGFKWQLESDRLKRTLCEENGVDLFYYSDIVFDFPYQVWTDIDKLLNFITNEKNF